MVSAEVVPPRDCLSKIAPQLFYFSVESALLIRQACVDEKDGAVTHSYAFPDQAEVPDVKAKNTINLRFLRSCCMDEAIKKVLKSERESEK